MSLAQRCSHHLRQTTRVTLHCVTTTVYTVRYFVLLKCFQYVISKVQETNLGLDMNGTQQPLALVDDVNLTGDDIRAIERNADVLLNACKDIGLAVNREN